MLNNTTRLLAIFILLISFNSCKKEENVVPVKEETFAVDPEFEKELFRLQIDNAINGLLRKSEVEKVERLALSGSGSIKTLKGLEHFVNLKSLSIFDVKIDSLDLSNSLKLEYLFCRTIGIEGGGSSLTYLNVKNCKALKHLDCSYNLLTKLDLSGNTALTFLAFSSNPELKEVDLSANVALDSLECYFLQNLTKLDVSKNTRLTTINSEGTSVQELDLGMLPDLKALDIRNAGVSTLKLKAPTMLQELLITGSKVSFSDPGIFPKLQKLYFGTGQFSTDLRSLPDLKTLYVNNVNATSIDLSGNKNLESLTLFESQFTALDLKNNPKLNELSLFKLTRLTELDLRHATELTYFGSFQSDNLKTICVSKIPEASSVFWHKDDWSAYTICK